jgi:hypothetical protein
VKSVEADEVSSTEMGLSDLVLTFFGGLHHSGERDDFSNGWAWGSNSPRLRLRNLPRPTHWKNRLAHRNRSVIFHQQDRVVQGFVSEARCNRGGID